MGVVDQRFEQQLERIRGAALHPEEAREGEAGFMTAPGGLRPVRLSMPSARDEIPHRRVPRGTIRRMLPYARPYRWQIALLLFATVVDACIAAAGPLMLKLIIDRGIAHRNLPIVVGLSLTLAGLALVDAAMSFVQSAAKRSGVPRCA